MGTGYLDLEVGTNRSILLRNELGIHFALCFCKSAGTFILAPKFSWVREVRTKGKNTTVNFVSQNNSFTPTGYFPDRSLFSPGASITGIVWNGRLAMELYYDGAICGGYSDHTYGGQVRFGF